MAGVPTSIIVPFVGVEFDSSRANVGTPVMPFTVGLIGQKLPAGTAVEGNIYRVFTESEAIDLAGQASMLHNQAKSFFANNNVTEMYLLPLDDAAGATQATVTITITGPADGRGSIDLELDSVPVSSPVETDDAATAMGDALVAAFAEYDNLGWTVANALGVVTLTARNGGIAASDIDIRLSQEPGYKLPNGVTVTIGAVTPGTNDPDVQDALDGIGEVWLNALANPYTDNPNLAAIEDYLEVAAGPTIQKDGVCYQALRGTVGELTAAATTAGRNSQFMVLLDGAKRTATYKLSAATVGAIAASAQEDPAVPLHRIGVRGVYPNLLSERRKLLEANTLAKNGVATYTDDLGVQTQATVTMYLRNSAGALDISYQQQNTLFNLMDLRWSFVNRILSRYPRAKLLETADRLLPGQQFLTPAKGKAEAIDWFREKEAQGRVQNADLFKETVICRISEVNPNRLEWLLPPDLVKQFIVGSGVMQFA